MAEFFKAYWPWIVGLLIVGALIFGALEYRDAVASILPGEGGGGAA